MCSNSNSMYCMQGTTNSSVHQLTVRTFRWLRFVLPVFPSLSSCSMHIEHTITNGMMALCHVVVFPLLVHAICLCWVVKAPCSYCNRWDELHLVLHKLCLNCITTVATWVETCVICSLDVRLRCSRRQCDKEWLSKRLIQYLRAFTTFSVNAH